LTDSLNNVHYDLIFNSKKKENLMALTKKFHGVYAALLTPFEENGKVALNLIEPLLQFLIKKGIHGLYVCGGSGEGPLMDLEERKEVMKKVQEVAENKLSLIAHVGVATNTRNATLLAEYAEKIGYDGVSSVAPTYYNYAFREIHSYYATIASASSLPFFVYYIPLTTGVKFVQEQFSTLGEIKNIQGIKYTDPNMYILQNILLLMKGRWIAFSGPDEMFLPALTMGVSGSIGTTQNILPEIFLDIYNAFKKGDVPTAMALQQRITEAVSLLQSYGGLASWKAAGSFRGINTGFARAPQRPCLSKEENLSLQKRWKTLFPDYSEVI
jgi:N-acetylneuraminate lyase